MSITLQGIDFEITGAINARTAANIDKVTNSLKNLRNTMSNAKLGNGYREVGAIGGTSSDGERASGSGSIGGSASAGRMSSLISGLRETRNGFKTAGQAAGEFYNSIKRIAMYRMFRTILKEIVSGAKEGATNLYQFSKAGGDLGVFAASMDSIATSFLYLKNSIGAMISPIINALAPALDWIIDKLVAILNLVNQVIAILTGAGTWNKALKYPTKFADAATGKIKELKKTILGFDEINKLNDPTKSGSGKTIPDYSKMFEVSEFQGKMAEIQALIQKHMTEVEAILAAFEFALGAILMLTGHPIIGLAMMAHGAYKLFNINGKVDWNSASTELANVLTMIEGVVAGFALTLGTFLLLTGNIPLGLGMIAVGAAMLWQSASVNWNAANADITTALSTIEGIVSGAFLALGVILLLTGQWGLGLACIIGGLSTIVASVAVNWNSASTEVGKQFQDIALTVGASLMAIGVILVLTGNVALGIGAMVAGAGAFFAAAMVDWDAASTKIKDVLQDILLIAGASLMAIGLIFFLTGNFALGLGGMFLGAAAYFTGGSINWDAATDKIQKTFDKIGKLWSDFKKGIERKWEDLKNWWKNLELPSFRIKTPHISWGSQPASGWIANILSALGMPTSIPKMNISWYKHGGFPTSGQLFIANEDGSGAEMVGSMNGRTAVANNQQIIEGIRQGVKDANSDEVRLLREQNNLLRAILEKEGNVEVPLSTITDAMSRKNQRDGGTFVPVG